MTRLALPGPEAQALNHALAREAQVAMLRFEAAKSIQGHLVGVDYHMAMAEAARKADPYGTSGENEDRPAELRFHLDVGCSARTAVIAADALLIALGIIKPPAQPKVNDGPR